MQPGSTLSPSSASFARIRQVAFEPLREGGGEARRHVLNDEDARSVWGKGRQDFGQRGYASGRCADCDDAVGGFSEHRLNWLDRLLPVLAGKVLNVDGRRCLYPPADILRHQRKAVRQIDGGLGHHVHRAGLSAPPW